MFLHWNTNYSRSPKLGCAVYTLFVEKALAASTIHRRWTSYWKGLGHVANSFIHSSQINSPLTTIYFTLLYMFICRDISKAHLKVQYGLVPTSCFLLLACFFFWAATVFPILLLLHFVLCNLSLLLVFKVFSPSILSMPFFIWTLPNYFLLLSPFSLNTWFSSWDCHLYIPV